MRTVGVVSVARSDYGMCKPLLRALDEHIETEPMLFVGGAHLAERFGMTVGEIEEDGRRITERVPFLGDNDSASDVAESLGHGVAGFARAFAERRPDVVVVIGDRFEMFAAASAAAASLIPLAHVHGGERSEGALDESFRHAITKLSHLHFVAADEYGARVRQLGEESWRVIVTGAPALDEIREAQTISDDELEKRFDLSFERPVLLVTFHPETLELDRTEEHARAVVDAVRDSGFDAIFTGPNADAGNTGITSLIERAATTETRFRFVPSLGHEAYYATMRRALAMVGNSSSGIIEAASFGLPVVNVGNRQRGRLRPDNVVDVAPEREAIAAAIASVTRPAFRAAIAGKGNPYGDGHAAPRIVDALATIPLDERLHMKAFVDV